MSVLRPLIHDDLDTLIEIQREGAIAGLGNIFPQETHPFPSNEIRERWSREIDDPGIDVYAALDADGTLAGFSATRGDELLHFGTAVNTWGHGLAQRAHDASVERLRAAGHDSARLRVFEENRRARRLYERNGWRADGSRSRTSFPPHPVLIGYTLDLRRTPSDPFVLEAGEPFAGPWQELSDADLRDTFVGGTGLMPQGAGLILVDGRSGSGKSTFAARVATLLDAPVVHTDDVAWHLHPTDWDDALITGVIEPWRNGAAVDYRPPGWIAKGREGSVLVPGAAPILIVEGVGAGRPSLRDIAGASVWVQSDAVVARDRGIRRDVVIGRTPHEAVEFWDEWAAAEDPFLAEAAPWDGADLIVTGTPPSTTPGVTFVSRSTA